MTVSGSQAEALPNFVVPVKLTTENFAFASAKGEGEDLRFTTTDGVVLDHEIELWSPTEAWVWVRVPMLPPSGQNLQLYAYSGNPAAAALPGTNVRSVWDASAFIAVWHLADDHDSSVSGLNGETVQVSGRIPSMVGTGISLDAAKQDHFRLKDNASIVAGLSQLSFSGWVRAKTGAGEGSRNFIAIGSDPRFGRGCHPAFDVTYDVGWLKARAQPVECDVTFTTCSPYKTETPVRDAPDIPLDTWIHVGLAVDMPAKKTELYENGVLVETWSDVPYDETQFAADHVSHASALGANCCAGSWFAHADLDEFRLHKVARTAAWFQAEHASMTSAQFAVVGPVEARPN